MGKSYDVTGEIHTIHETKAYGANNFEKREFVIKVTGEGENDQYPNYLAIDLIKDKCELISQYQIGQEIKVHFNLGGRLWSGSGKPEKCFNSLTAWKIEAMQQAPPQQQEEAYTPPSSQAPAPQEFDDNFDVGGDQIPF